MRYCFLAILFLLSFSALGNSKIATQQAIYEKVSRTVNEDENTALLRQALTLPCEDSKSLLLKNLSIYKQLANKFLEFSVNDPLSRNEYSLIWNFARIYPITGEKTFTEALTCYLKNDWEKSEQVLNYLMQNGEKRLGVLLLLGNIAAYHGRKDNWMFNQVLEENPFGAIDFLDIFGLFVLSQNQRQDSCRWVINLFSIIEKHQELLQNEYFQMKLRYIAEQIFLGIERWFCREHVSQAQLDAVLQQIISQIQQQEYFLAVDKVLVNVTYKLKYKFEGSRLIAYLAIQKCEPTSKELKKIIPAVLEKD